MRGRGLKLGGRLDRYVGSLFLSSYATAFLLVVGLFLILDMTANIDEFVETWDDGSSAPVALIVRFYLLNIPFLFLQISPFVTLVAGLFTVSRLLRLLAGVGSFALREAVSPHLANQRDGLKWILENKSWDETYEDLWLRDLQGNVLHLREFRPSTGSPPRAEVRGLEATLRSEWMSIEAARAVYVDRGGHRGWRLENGIRREVHGTLKSEPVEMLEGFEFSPALALSFHRARENPLELSFAEAREMARRDPYNVVYLTLLQYHLTFPLANIVLLLVGLPVLMRHDRRKTAEALAASCILCIVFFAVDFIFRNLGLQGGIEPRLAAWLPILFFGSVGLVLFDSMRT
jgi:lipopolysaccharide export system permease protein